MQYRLVGRTGLLVSVIGLGANTFGGSSPRWQAFGALDRSGVGAVLGAAIDAGVNLIDLADTYGDGESETRVGEAIADIGISRHALILSAKSGLRVGRGPNEAGLSRAHIFNSVENSLRKLKTDYLDIFMMHTFDPLTPLEETLGALDVLVRQGKIRYAGCSNLAAWQVALALGAADAHRLPRIECVEANYTVAARVIERELIPLLTHQKIGLFVWGPLGAGLLTGKYTRDGAGPEGARLASGASTMANRERALDAVDAMKPIADAKGVSVGRIALAWLLHKPAVASIIAGCRNPEQLRDNIAALDLTLAPEDMSALDAIAALPVEYPFNMQANAAANRWPS